MVFIRVFTAALSGIVLMTLFSFAYSTLTGNPFREPRLLNFLFRRWHLQAPGFKDHIAGYAVHYLVGLWFVVLYEMLWLHTGVPISWTVALLLGIVSGVVGIAGWKTMFSLTKYPPRINFTRYYVHLFAAHIFFALGVIAVYKLWPMLLVPEPAD